MIAQHTCPVFPKAPAKTPLAAVAGSQSARTIAGSLPPISSVSRFTSGAAAAKRTGAAVACAMNAGNLLDVGRQLQRHYPSSPLIIAGDDDRQTEGNPGRTAANKAAAVLGCGVVMPPFPSDAPLALSDFNDLANWRAAQ